MVCSNNPAHAKLRYLEHAAQLYSNLCTRRAHPDGHDFVAILKAFARARSLIHGRVVHAHVLESGLQHNMHIRNTLIHMYLKCGGLDEACTLFQHMPQRDVVTWNAMIAGYAQLAHSEMALQLWQRMQHEGMDPDKFTFVCILKACSAVTDLNQGKLIHNLIIESALECDVFIGSTLIDMYANCASVEDARSVFDRLPEQNLVTWNALISGYAQHGDGWEAIQLFLQMHRERLIPNQATFVSILKACSSMAALRVGKHIHAHIVEFGYNSNVFIESTLIDMYSQCRCLDESLWVFNMSMKQDMVTWSALIAGFVRNGNDQEAISYFREMQLGGIQVSEIIYVCILKACSNTRAREQGKMIHVYIIENGLGLKIHVANTLIDMYVKCGILKEAQILFNKLPKRDVVTWNSLVAGYAQHCRKEAFVIFHCMQQEGIDPDHVTIVCILKACSRLVALDQGRHIHGYLKESGFPCDLSIRNALIDMYNKCGSLNEAHKLFNHMSERDAVTWSAMIAGFVEHGHAKEALVHFQQMLQEGTNPNQGVLVCVLSVCADGAALHTGKLIHAHIIDNGFDSDTAVGNALIDMYANSGSLEDACMVFQRMQARDEKTWTSMISGFGRCHNYKLAVQYFVGMQRDGLKPNDVTFICLLSACSHIGLLEEGCNLFRSIAEEHNISLTVEHYNCVVDLLGREKQLKNAEELLISMPFHCNIVGWTCLLGHCRTHGNMELARQCFDKVIAMDPGNASAYALMVGMHVDAGMQEELKKGVDAWKEPGKAAIEIGKTVQSFCMGDKSPRQDSLKSVKLTKLYDVDGA